MTNQEPPSVLRIPIAGLLAWLVPGLGHIYLGHRARGMICLIIITVTFWSGVAIGGVQGTVAPHSRGLWFIAQLGTGGNALSAYALHRIVSPETAAATTPVVVGHWMSADVGVHYTGVAGLLNLLILLDAIVRADGSARPDRRRASAPVGGT